ncbi:MAG: hypothetical protein IJ165_07235 [Proteobacteria bacterium]|nr:hypothetical protein [Pseudomonadota bacterium]
MKTHYQAICEHIQPKDILHYLKRFGKVAKIADYRDTSAVYEVSSKRFLIPKHTGLDDYAQVVEDLIQKIGKFENRSVDDILDTLEQASVDILSFRNICEDTSDGTIPMWQCQKFVQGASDMVEAVACSASTQRRSYLGKKPQEAEDYFRKIKFGQTKIGSFVINLRCPIEQEFNQLSLYEDERFLPDEPYSNKVLPLLDKALGVAFEYARDAMARDDISELIEHPELGLSSNFFDALTLLHESTCNGKFEISTNPAINRKRAFVPKIHSFNGEYIECFRAASKQIKELEPLPDTTVCGPVVNINKKPEAEFKSITIRDVTGRKTRDILVCLKDDDYDNYYEHFKDGIIRVIGTLITARGKQSKIMDYSTLEIVDAKADGDNE